MNATTVAPAAPAPSVMVNEIAVTTQAVAHASLPDDREITQREARARVALTFRTDGQVEVSVLTTLAVRHEDGSPDTFTSSTNFSVDSIVWPALSEAFTAALRRATAKNLCAMVEQPSEAAPVPAATPASPSDVDAREFVL